MKKKKIYKLKDGLKLVFYQDKTKHIALASLFVMFGGKNKKVLKQSDLLVSPCKRASDGDMDGMADVYVLDMNGNGTLEEEEFIPIRDQSLAMAPLREAVYGQEPLVVQDDDYINNADVDDFMA